MSVLTGIGGAVNAVPGIADWEIQVSKDLKALATSGSKGAMLRVVGNKSWSGSYRVYLDQPLQLPGDAFTFLGSIDGTSGAAGTAIVDEVQVVADLEAANPVVSTVKFSSNGDLTLGANVATDTAAPTITDALGIKAATGTVVATPVWTDISDVRKWTLTLKTDNKQYVSSTTPGITKRKKGNIDASFTIDVYCSDFAVPPQPGDIKAVRLYSTAARFWEIYWGIFGELTGLKVDRETAALVGATCNGSLNGATVVGGAATVGHVTPPSTTVWWPAA
jgi:hypothetical protein